MRLAGYASMSVERRVLCTCYKCLTFVDILDLKLSHMCMPCDKSLTHTKIYNCDC